MNLFVSEEAIEASDPVYGSLNSSSCEKLSTRKYVCPMCNNKHRLFANHVTANYRKNSVCTVPGCGKRHTKFIHTSGNSHGAECISATVLLQKLILTQFLAIVFLKISQLGCPCDDRWPALHGD